MDRGNNAYVGFNLEIMQRKEQLELIAHERDYLCICCVTFSIAVGEILTNIDKTLTVKVLELTKCDFLIAWYCKE